MPNYGELTSAVGVISAAGLAASAYYVKGRYSRKENSQDSQKLQTSDESSIDDLTRSIQDMILIENSEEVWSQYSVKSENTTTFDSSSPKQNPWNLNNTFLKDVLTARMYRELSMVITRLGSTLDDCIRPGTDNPEGNTDDVEKGCGVVACDAYCYVAYRELFEKVIKLRYPKYDAEPDIHSRLCDFTTFNLVTLPKLDCSQVRRLEVELRRNLQNHKFPPGISRKQRRHVMDILTTALTDCAKTFYDAPSVVYGMTRLTDHDIWELSQLNLLPEISENFYEQSAGLRRDWPDGRAVWFCKDLKVAAVLNVMDHMVLKTWSTDGNITKLAKFVSTFYKNLSRTLKIVNERFAKDQRGKFGYLTSFPELLGSAMVFRADVDFEGFHPNKKEATTFRDQVENDTGLVIRCLQVNDLYKCSTLTVETEAGLGYNDYKLLEMFGDGIKRLLKLRDEKLVKRELN